MFVSNIQDAECQCHGHRTIEPVQDRLVVGNFVHLLGLWGSKEVRTSSCIG